MLILVFICQNDTLLTITCCGLFIHVMYIKYMLSRNIRFTYHITRNDQDNTSNNGSNNDQRNSAKN